MSRRSTPTGLSSQISPYEKGLPSGNKGAPHQQESAPHQRHGDRGSSDDAPVASARLPQFVRARDLFAAGIVSNWQTLHRLIDEYGFPAGILLSPNIRVWDLADVEQWLAARPIARKAAPRHRLDASRSQMEVESAT